MLLFVAKNHITGLPWDVAMLLAPAIWQMQRTLKTLTAKIKTLIKLKFKDYVTSNFTKQFCRIGSRLVAFTRMTMMAGNEKRTQILIASSVFQNKYGKFIFFIFVFDNRDFVFHSSGAWTPVDVPA